MIFRINKNYSIFRHITVKLQNKRGCLIEPERKEQLVTKDDN